MAVFPSSKIDFWPYLKLQKMEFGQKKIIRVIDLFDFTSFFFAWTFLNFLAHCDTPNQLVTNNPQPSLHIWGVGNGLLQSVVTPKGKQILSNMFNKPRLFNSKFSQF